MREMTWREHFSKCFEAYVAALIIPALIMFLGAIILAPWGDGWKPLAFSGIAVVSIALGFVILYKDKKERMVHSCGAIIDSCYGDTTFCHHCDRDIG